MQPPRGMDDLRKQADVYQRICEICSREFEAGPTARYCSRPCVNRGAYLRSKQNGMYEKMLARRKMQYWNGRANPDIPCHTCGASIGAARPGRKFCSPKCSREGQAKGCATPECSRPLRANGLCNVCYRKARGENSIWTDARRDRYHRRRALKKAAATGRPVVLAEIRDRDEDFCHLCGEVVPDLAWPDPLSPSLDHVVPLSRGGIHDPDNVRLAHLRCNVEKGDRLLVD